MVLLMKYLLSNGVPSKFEILITNKKSNIIKAFYFPNFDDASHNFKKIVAKEIDNDDTIFYFENLEKSLESPFPVYFIRRGFYKFGKLILDEYQFEEPTFNYFENNDNIFEFKFIN